MQESVRFVSLVTATDKRYLLGPADRFLRLRARRTLASRLWGLPVRGARSPCRIECNVGGYFRRSPDAPTIPVDQAALTSFMSTRLLDPGGGAGGWSVVGVLSTCISASKRVRLTKFSTRAMFSVTRRGLALAPAWNIVKLSISKSETTKSSTLVCRVKTFRCGLN